MYILSRVAQRKRVGPITRRSLDRNQFLLISILIYIKYMIYINILLRILAALINITDLFAGCQGLNIVCRLSRIED